ncbi:PTS lactose/cellobiose transporter subunit IIA [Peptoniphilaceae bacterium SGI.137]|nr:PTS lactose/cellobiose transporter subunit IIA [Peptoniphilaceae bacterium]MDY4196439.1 PTS lactose/cellobiose transporter subunit IIA [Peptoniphilaceae bacterium]MDY5842760.1 PTS lactose/cellobiose transporter subunit IIA [Peptoniphilaceae bacterium]MDY6147131.1 PTS lactose/cellobiose transporter subunit IIA [Peptoniphilaceae bacterium]
MSEVNEKDYELIFQIILSAGQARTTAEEAMNKLEEYDFDAFDRLIEQAKTEYIQCHEMQTGMLNKEASGERNEVNIFLVHAQDHITMASLTLDHARRFRKIYEELNRVRAAQSDGR